MATKDDIFFDLDLYDWQGLFRPEGRPQPGVRLAWQLALAVLVLLYVVLARSEGWRF